MTETTFADMTRYVRLWSLQPDGIAFATHNS